MFQYYSSSSKGAIFFTRSGVTLFPKSYNIARFTFTRNERLKSRKLIEQLFKNGRPFLNHPFRILYYFSTSGPMPLQAGFTVSKKNFKKAVDRNRIKRLMKEGYRIQKNNLISKLQLKKRCMTVFFIYTGHDLPEHKIVFQKIDMILNKLEKIVDESLASNT